MPGADMALDGSHGKVEEEAPIPEDCHDHLLAADNPHRFEEGMMEAVGTVRDNLLVGQNFHNQVVVYQHIPHTGRAVHNN